MRKFFDILDGKAKTDEDKKILDSIKDTLKAVANFFVKVLTIGYKKGFDRSKHETKTDFQSSVKKIEKSFERKSHIEHANKKENNELKI